MLSATACFGIKDEDFKELSPITFNEVSGVIDVNIGTELIYTDLKVTSSLPVTYEWSYGQRKQNGSLEDMANITTISDKADIRYTFNRVGTYVLRLKVDNGEDYTLWDCDYCNLQSDINSAEVNQIISPEQAWYLREKYLRMERE